MRTNGDPVLDGLARIEAKQDEILAKQDRMDSELKQIHDDCRRTAAITGAVTGAVSGGLISTGIAFVKAKLGI